MSDATALGALDVAHTELERLQKVAVFDAAKARVQQAEAVFVDAWRLMVSSGRAVGKYSPWAEYQANPAMRRAVTGLIVPGLAAGDFLYACTIQAGLLLSLMNYLTVVPSMLAEMPRAYPLVPRYEGHGIRRCAYRDYLIFYRVMDDLIEVIHILHGARNYEALLFPEDLSA
ncbi:type II toxin-antitoxin system RelE/ParE family toxin [Candidatus Methylospira mobilis]|uniref:type II toxin-antitoxin system RelE/ParE family toxin n=1 Tax=Candidatus Methylospira mobilis TaxID=1808979 RepID=UPI001D17C52B|nr:type II toxin-antitoxin system RelE/ParE family toxin [Candidatus Methylospira mobilis]WNV05648.1 type II toxin-antitoxin system RelE/ParE family toxin [Candidatus Methylospira mobilis]